MTLEEELGMILNRHSAENRSGTPDFVLAQYLLNCLHAYDQAVVDRESWRSRRHKRGQKECQHGKMMPSYGDGMVFQKYDSDFCPNCGANLRRERSER